VNTDTLGGHSGGFSCALLNATVAMKVAETFAMVEREIGYFCFRNSEILIRTSKMHLLIGNVQNCWA
jgi:hypothetical protein